MVHVIVRHKVADYGKWKQAFDAYLNHRMAAGETGFRIFQSLEDPRDVTVLTDWESTEHARRFMQSDDLRTTMQSAGVVGSPDVTYVLDAMNVRRTAAD
jgi:heme-degrading monooxygenase HmoA